MKVNWQIDVFLTHKCHPNLRSYQIDNANTTSDILRLMLAVYLCGY
jgi:hypothetical protein